MSLSEEYHRPSLSSTPVSSSSSVGAEDSDDSGVHLKQSRSLDSDSEPLSEKDNILPFDLSREGTLLWAKIRGFSYWPGVITVDPFEGLTNKVNQKPSMKRKAHVHFLAYDNLRAWVSEADILPYEGFTKYKELANSLPKRKKDFEPGKKFKNIFERAVQEAEDVQVTPLHLRLEKLGFVYIPTRKEDGSENNVLQKKRNKKKTLCKEVKAQSRPPKKMIDDDADLDSDSISSAKEPKLGSLIWGHMAGFPYWPCFVTRSSDGDYIRESSKGNKCSIHVQFFNWNAESGWVNKTLPWCSMGEFRRLGKEAIRRDSSSAGNWCPVGKMYHKWKNAALEAESTLGLSRKERHNRFIIGNKRMSSTLHHVIKSPPPPLITTSTRLPPGWIIRYYRKEDYGQNARTEYQSPDGAVFLTIENAISYLFQQNNSSSSRKRSYSSPGGVIQKAGSESSLFSNLPPGPASKKRRLDAGWFISESDSLRYPSSALRPSTEYLDLSGSVLYLRDASLPRGWSVKRVSSVGLATPPKYFYLPPPETNKSFVTSSHQRKEFDSKADAASYFEGMGHPAVELEHVIATGLLQCHSRGTSLFKVDEYLEHRLLETPLLRKIACPSFVRVEPLPKEAYADQLDEKKILKDVE